MSQQREDSSTDVSRAIQEREQALEKKIKELELNRQGVEAKEKEIQAQIREMEAQFREIEAKANELNRFETQLENKRQQLEMELSQVRTAGTYGVPGTRCNCCARWVASLPSVDILRYTQSVAMETTSGYFLVSAFELLSLRCCPMVLSDNNYQIILRRIL